MPMLSKAINGIIKNDIQVTNLLVEPRFVTVSLAATNTLYIYSNEMFSPAKISQ